MAGKKTAAVLTASPLLKIKSSLLLCNAVPGDCLSHHRRRGYLIV
jgi:hypothetical protein